MKIVEERHPGEPWLMHWLGNATAVDGDNIRSIGIAWLFKEDDKWVFAPRVTENKSLFYNAVFFARLCWVPGIFFSFRWSAATDSKAIFQCGLGYKLNGRLTITLRVQSDKTSAAGVTGPNTGN